MDPRAEEPTFVNTLRLAAALLALFLPGAMPAVQAADPTASMETPVEPVAAVRQLFDVRTPMRDGVELSADVWLPAKPGRYPVILLRTPYIKTMPMAELPQLAAYFASHGYAFVIQDVRGRGDSAGEFNFFFQEGEDGHDSVETLAEASWSNGRVCMMGVSYWGTVQWLAARERPSGLACIAPTSPAGQYLDELPYSGGAFMMAWALFWLNDTSGRISQGPNAATVDWESIYSHRPLITMDEAMGRKMRLYREFLTHHTMDDYWKRVQFTAADFRKLDLPVLTIAGWFDGDQPGTLFYWQGMNKYSPSKHDRHLVIGPWTHIQSFLGGETQVGDMSFSEDSVLDMKQLHLDFFNRYLKQSTASFDQPRVRLYMTGRNQWLSLDHYPLTDANPTRLYLHSSGNAQQQPGGDLSLDPPTAGGTDRYTYDPRNPVPLDLMATGPYDRQAIQQREDVLTYTTAPRQQALDVVGPVSVELYAESDARDTDFTAAVLDVHPDGRAVPLGPKTVGIIRARYRNGLAQTELLTPGTVERYTIELGHIAHSFQPGHSIRVEISSSAFPMYNPNQNTGNPVATDTEWRSARQTIHHSSGHPSALVLPVADVATLAEQQP